MPLRDRNDQKHIQGNSEQPVCLEKTRTIEHAVRSKRTGAAQQ